MAIVKDLGMVTAYAYAVAGGYEGTEAEFEEMLGQAGITLEQLENLTAVATTLSEGSEATASYSDGVLTFGIPRGNTGAKGNKGDKGDKGDTGNGIASIVKTGTSGLVDTYTITFTDGTTTTFEVTNGADGDITNVAQAFDATKAYSVGDIVLYQGTLYAFTAAHAAGAWVGSDAQAVILADEVTELKDDLINEITTRDITGEFGVGAYTQRNFTRTYENRISNLYLYKVSAGDRITYSTGSLLAYFGQYLGNSNTLIQVKAYGSAVNESFTIPDDGYLVMTFKKSDNSNLTMDDFDANVSLSLKRAEKYHGEVIKEHGYNAMKILKYTSVSGKAHNDFAIYGDYLVSGLNADTIQIYNKSTAELISTITIAGNDHFNNMQFSPSKYSDSDMFPLLYAETELLNGVYNVIRIIDQSTAEIVKKYRFDESIYGQAPQIFWDFEHNVAYGICIPVTGRAPLYDFYKFDLSNETENQDGTYTPAVLYAGKIENPGTRQGGQFYDGRVYLMTLGRTSSPYNNKIKVYNVYGENPAMVTMIENTIIPDSEEGEGLSVTNENGKIAIYAGTTSNVYKFIFD